MKREMGIRAFGVVLVLLAGAGLARAESFYVETFDAGNAGWMVWGTGSEAGWSLSGGNPDGHITADIGPGVYKVQAGDADPYAFPVLPGAIATDIRVDSVSDPADAYVRFFVGDGDGGYFATTGRALTTFDLATWTRFEVAVDVGNFVYWDGASAAVPVVDQAALAAALMAPAGIGLLFSGHTLGQDAFPGTASISIDNFDSVPPVPEPLTMLSAFLAIGSFGMYVRKHTRKQAAR